jgi:hypothetical protein
LRAPPAEVGFSLGGLLPRVGFIVTNLETDSRSVVRFYNKRGTSEQWMKKGKQAVKMTRLSCHRFRSNEVRLWLSLIAYNLGNVWRRLVLPRKIENWSLTRLQQRLVKTGGKLVKHARYYWLLLAESHLTRRLFGSMVRRIDALAVAPAVTPAKSGDQGVEVGDVFVEIIEKTQFPGFQFFRQVEFGAWQSQRRLPEKELRSEEQDLGVCDMLSPIQEPKWKSWCIRSCLGAGEYGFLPPGAFTSSNSASIRQDAHVSPN